MNDAFSAPARFLAVRVELDEEQWLVFRSREDPAVTIRFLDGFRELCAAGLVMHHLYRDFSLTRAGFELQLGWFGGTIVSLGSFLFGFSTLLGWCYYGEQCMRYLLGGWVIKPYRMIFIIFLFMGAMLQGRYLQIVWYVGDIASAFMAFPNLLGLIFLSGLTAKLTASALKTGIDKPWRPDMNEVNK